MDSRHAVDAEILRPFIQSADNLLWISRAGLTGIIYGEGFLEEPQRGEGVFPAEGIFPHGVPQGVPQGKSKLSHS